MKNLLEKIGINESLLISLSNDNKIIINDDIDIIDNNIYIRFFLECLKNRNDLVEDYLDVIYDKDAYNFCMLLKFLFIGNVNFSKVYLDKAIKGNYNSEYTSFLLLIDILLNGNIHNVNVIYEDNEYIGEIIKVLKKYIILRQFDMINYILDEILKIDNNIYFIILKNIVCKINTDTPYICNEEDIKDDVTFNGIKSLERKMLFYLNLKKYNKFLEMGNLLKDFYIDMTPYVIMENLVKYLKSFMHNYRLISKRDLRGAYGTFDNIILGLINSNDFYRVKDVIYEDINTSGYSIKNDIYKMLIDEIMYYNKRNLGYVESERKSFMNLENEEELISRYPVSRISIDDIQNEEKKTVDFSKNYYNVYLSFKEKGLFRQAKRALEQFIINMKSTNINVCFDFLFKELEYEIENENMSEDKKKIAKELFNKAYDAEKNHEYLKAIPLYLNHLSYLNVKNPRIYAYIAHCYYNIGNLNEAYKYFLIAEKGFLYPDDIIVILEILIKLEKYKEVIDYFPKYEKYNTDGNAYVHYLLSIAYLNLEEYDLAEDALSTADAINIAVYNTLYSYDYEHEVISKLKRGIKVRKYTMDDFLDWDLNLDEKEIEEEISKQEKSNKMSYLDIIRKDVYNGNIIDKIDYLLSVIKIYNYNEDTEKECELIEFVEGLLKNPKISEDDRSRVYKKLNVYKSGILYI